MPSSEGLLKGHIDYFDQESVSGWVRHRCSAEPPVIRLTKAKKKVAEGIAFHRRRDLERLDARGVTYGFRLPVGPKFSGARFSFHGLGNALRLKVLGDCGCRTKVFLGLFRDDSTDEIVIESWDGRFVQGWLKGKKVVEAILEQELDSSGPTANRDRDCLSLHVSAGEYAAPVMCELATRTDLDEIFGPGIAFAFKGVVDGSTLPQDAPIHLALGPEGPQAVLPMAPESSALAEEWIPSVLDLSLDFQRELVEISGSRDLTGLLHGLNSGTGDHSIPILGTVKPTVRDQAEWYRIRNLGNSSDGFAAPLQHQVMDAIEAIEFIHTLGSGHLFSDGQVLAQLNAVVVEAGDASASVPLTGLQFAFWYRFHRELDFYDPQRMADLLYYFIRWVEPVAESESLLLLEQRNWLKEVSTEYDFSGLSSRITDASLRFHSGPRGMALPGDIPGRLFLLMHALTETRDLSGTEALMNADQSAWFLGNGESLHDLPLWERSIQEQIEWLRVHVYCDEGSQRSVGRMETAGEANTGELSIDANRRLVQVVGLIGHPSGVGRNADLTLDALALVGWEALSTPVDFSRDPVGRELLGCADLRSDAPMIVHAQPEYIANLYAFGFPHLARVPVIGFFSWEMETLPPAQAWGAAQVDEIWVPSEFSASAFRGYCSSVEVVHHAVDVRSVVPASRQALKIPPDAYVVHFAFDTHSTLARKNPLGVVEAFLKAFDSDHSAYLLLKARNLSALQEMADRGDRDARKLLHEVHVHPRIRLVGREVSRGNALGLLALSDCHLSLHRAEGFGYGMAEAMALGVPVVATGYSGNMAFMDSQNSWPVAYQLRSVNRGEYLFEEPGFRWAEPDIDDAAEQLIACRTGQDRQHRIDLARMRITENFSLSVMSRRMSELLERRRR